MRGSGGRYKGASINGKERAPPFMVDLLQAPPFSPPHSAGIGRTGVFITMETAMQLIEKKQPVYPLDLVRKMRDQRAMMVQTGVRHSTGHNKLSAGGFTVTD